MIDAGQVALVTGAAGAVGSAIAARLVARGVAVRLIGRTLETLHDLVSREGWRGDVKTYAVDLAAHDEAVLDFCDRFRAEHTSLDLLVHSAGVISIGSVAELPVTDFDRQYRVNVRAPYLLTQNLLPLLTRSQSQVVFVNSSAGVQSREGVAQYGATKHALRALADSFRQEVNPLGVRVLSVFLGRTASRMQASVHAREGRPYVPGRLLQPDDVASVVVHSLDLPRTAEVTDIHIR